MPTTALHRRIVAGAAGSLIGGGVVFCFYLMGELIKEEDKRRFLVNMIESHDVEFDEFDAIAAAELKIFKVVPEEID